MHDFTREYARNQRKANERIKFSFAFKGTLLTEFVKLNAPHFLVAIMQ